MKKAYHVILAVLLLSGLARADNLIANGDFSQPIDNGWTVFSTGDNGTASIVTGDAPYGDVSQSFKGKVTLYQVIPVDNLNLELSFSGKFHTEVTKEGYGALAKLAVVYCDADTNTLGKTVFGRASGIAELQSGDTEHSIVAKADNTWADYALDLGKELSANLKKVDRSKVRFLRIGITVDNGEPTGC
jgi:hypothetical protein